MAKKIAAIRLEGATSPVRRFSTRPTNLFIEEVRDHTRRTQQPETFPGLHPGPLPRTAQFIKLARIEVDRMKRPALDQVPCPMCQPNKFLKGFLVYFPELEAAAVIGHCCAVKEAREAADREYAQRSRRDE